MDESPHTFHLLQSSKRVDVESETPLIDSVVKFRFASAKWILFAVFLIVVLLIGGSVGVLFVLAFGDKPDNTHEHILSTVQAVLTTSIGLIGGIATTVINYFFQSKEQ